MYVVINRRGYGTLFSKLNQNKISDELAKIICSSNSVPIPVGSSASNTSTDILNIPPLSSISVKYTGLFDDKLPNTLSPGIPDIMSDIRVLSNNVLIEIVKDRPDKVKQILLYKGNSCSYELVRLCLDIAPSMHVLVERFDTYNQFKDLIESARLMCL